MKFENVTQFIKDLVSVGGIYYVDDSGYVTNKHDDTPAMVKVEDKFKPILTLQEIMSDTTAIILNPLHENVADSVDGRWLYSTLSLGLTRRLIAVVEHVRLILDSDESICSPEFLEFASKHNGFDAKALEHFHVISKNMIEFVNVFYNRKLKEARLRCSVFDEDTKKLYPAVTKKSWTAIQMLMADIFGIPTDSKDYIRDLNAKYSVSSDLITVPKLESVLTVYLKIYTQINRLVDEVHSNDPDFTVDVTTLGAHIGYLAEYYNKSKWFNGQVLEKTEAPKQMMMVQDDVPRNIPMQGAPQITQASGGIPLNPAKHGFAPQHQGYAGFEQPAITYANGMPVTHGSAFGGQQNFGFQQPQQQFGFAPQQPQFGGFTPSLQQTGMIPTY